jgi:hypothetical protein
MFKLTIFILILLPHLLFGQQTKISGTVRDAISGEPLPFVTVRFQNSKIATLTDSVGNYILESYYVTDSVKFSSFGYVSITKKVVKDVEQRIDIVLPSLTSDLLEVIVHAPDELPSTRLHKRIVANKDVNNKEKLMAYEYKVYNKIQLDLNNIGDKFTERDIVKRLDVVMDYLDTADNGKNFLPVMLSETKSEFFYRKDPKKKKEVIQGTYVTGIENLQVEQFLGDMYLDINIYDNYILMFNKAFISPTANFARSFYRFYLEDSTFIDQYWCYKMRFVPKRKGDMTFQGEMWVHDTTYAIKQINANISPWANINYVQDLYFEHNFEMVAPEVWMLTSERMIVDVKLTKKTDLYGFYGRKFSKRSDFVINDIRSDDFYKSDNTVEIEEGAKTRKEDFWTDNRPIDLTDQEKGIYKMLDTLNAMPFFVMLKKLTYLSTTGYYQMGKIEIGNAFGLVSTNPVESFRTALALRTSNQFSRRIELGGKIAYGWGDERFKYGGSIRYNITPKKRGMLTGFYNYDIEQIGQSASASTVGSTFGTLLRTGPLDKLTMVTKAGISLEKDIHKDFVLFGGFEWKQFEALGVANYVNLDPTTGVRDTINSVRTGEFTARIRWGKDEEFISGAFDRSSLRSKYPIFSLQGIIGVKNIFGSNYDYQKVEFTMEHNRQIGIFGRLRYELNAGYVFGSAAYPFLKVHAGNQSYWLSTSTFNKLNFYEFISDKYVGALVEQHWEGLFFDRLPLLRKLQWRLVTTGRIIYGGLDKRHEKEMLFPTFTKNFGNIPYAEAAVGIENIFKVGRIDVVWRLTHLDPGVSPIGIRARWAINF